MKKENIFFIILTLTILLIRTEVFLYPSNHVSTNGLVVNHFWIGVIFILFVLFLSKSYNKSKLVIFSIGLALVVDELTFIIFSSRTINDYWSVYSILGVIIIMIIIFMYRGKLLDKLYKI